MKKKEVLEFFNGTNKTARALRISPAAVSKWPEVLTDRIAYKIELVTNGKLLTDETKRLKNET